MNIVLVVMYFFLFLEIVSPLFHVWVATTLREAIEKYNNGGEFDLLKAGVFLVKERIVSTVLCVADYFFLSEDAPVICSILVTGFIVWCIGIIITVIIVKRHIMGGNNSKGTTINVSVNYRGGFNRP
ncbi:MAG: hypothetical protein IJI83_05500 [Oscillospiraceae bacterium]|nr:hypothetical protein [Oscillospiraceae bacterium]